jgi:hypothetical protein
MKTTRKRRMKMKMKMKMKLTMKKKGGTKRKRKRVSHSPPSDYALVTDEDIYHFQEKIRHLRQNSNLLTNSFIAEGIPYLMRPNSLPIPTHVFLYPFYDGYPDRDMMMTKHNLKQLIRNINANKRGKSDLYMYHLIIQWWDADSNVDWTMAIDSDNDSSHSSSGSESDHSSHASMV